jgi:Superinfection immunity protein
MRDALYLMAVITGALLFFSPTIIAHWRQHHFRWPITAVNIVLGLTGIGWLAALVWAVWPEDPTRPRPVRLTRMDKPNQ